MLKKILLTVVVLLAVVGAVMLYGTYKVVDDAFKEKEPQLRQYMQLDEAAQNKYIIDNCAELLDGADLDKDGTPEEKENIELLKKANTNPEIQQALADVGRSVMAKAILMSDSITKDMSDDVKAKYQKESEQFDARADKYSKLIDAAGVK